MIVITISKERVFLICKERKKVTEKGKKYWLKERDRGLEKEMREIVVVRERKKCGRERERESEKREKGRERERETERERRGER